MEPRQAANQVTDAWNEAMQNLFGSAKDATAAFRWLEEQLSERWKPYKARWARKRTPRYLAKGGVKR